MVKIFTVSSAGTIVLLRCYRRIRDEPAAFPWKQYCVVIKNLKKYWFTSIHKRLARVADVIYLISFDVVLIEIEINGSTKKVSMGYLPKKIYRHLPDVYILVGIFVLLKIDHLIGFLSGLLLVAAGLFVFHFRLRRNWGSFRKAFHSGYPAGAVVLIGVNSYRIHFFLTATAS